MPIEFVTPCGLLMDTVRAELNAYRHDIGRGEALSIVSLNGETPTNATEH